PSSRRVVSSSRTTTCPARKARAVSSPPAVRRRRGSRTAKATSWRSFRACSRSNQESAQDTGASSLKDGAPFPGPRACREGGGATDTRRLFRTVRACPGLNRALRRVGLGKLQRIPIEEAVDEVGARAIRKEHNDDVDSIALRCLHQRRLIVLVAEIGI